MSEFNSRMGKRDHVFADVLGEAIALRGLSLNAIVDELRSRGLKSSLASLSYWRSGRSVPSRSTSVPVVETLEQILGTPPGMLTGALHTEEFKRWDPVALMPFDDSMLELLRGLDLEPFHRFGNHAVHDRNVWFDPFHQVGWTYELVESQVDGLDRIPIPFTSDPEDGGLPLLASGFGCELGRVLALDDEGLAVAEMILPRPLAKGELHYFEYTFTYDLECEGLEGNLDRTAAFGIPLVGIELEFAEVPTTLEFMHSPYRAVSSAKRDHTTRSPLPLSRWVNAEVRDMPPGTMGVYFAMRHALPVRRPGRELPDAAPEEL